MENQTHILKIKRKNFQKILYVEAICHIIKFPNYISTASLPNAVCEKNIY